MRIVIALFVLLLCMPAAVVDGDWYISGSLGAYMAQDRSSSSTSSTFVALPRSIAIPGPPIFVPASQTTTATTSTKPGPMISLGIGYRLPLGLRLEGEINYARFGSSQVNIASQIAGFAPRSATLPVASGGVRQRILGTIDLFYDLPASGPVVPYAGIGAGVFHAWATDGTLDAGFGTAVPVAGSSGTNVVVMAELGFSVNIAPGWDIVPAYRYMHLFAGSPQPPENAHILKIGARYSF